MNSATSLGRCWIVMGAAVLCLAAMSAADVFAAQPGATIAMTQDNTSVTISADGKPVLVYRFGDVPRKPYVKQFYTPSGVQVLRDSPADHKHHHALMLAVGIDGVDFWSENPNCGRQVHRGLEAGRGESRGGSARAEFTERLDWVGPKDDKPLATERRTIRVVKLDGVPASLVTWETRLSPAKGRPSIKLGGSQYFGLGVRFVESMDKVGRYFGADKEPKPPLGQHQLTRSRWVAYTAPVDGKPVTVAMLDAPTNPRHPASFFTLTTAFAYISATLDLAKEPLEVKAGQPLELRYAVALMDGEVQPAEVEKLYQRWVQELKAK